MIFRSLHAAETAEVKTPQTFGMSFPFGKKSGVNATAPIGGQQNGFGAIKNPGWIVISVEKRLLEFGGFRIHRQTGRRADDILPIQHQHNDAFGASEIGFQVFFLIFDGAVVKVGKVPEYLNAQTSQIRQEGPQFRVMPGKSADSERRTH